jgi:hypothetical protein
MLGTLAVLAFAASARAEQAPAPPASVGGAPTAAVGPAPAAAPAAEPPPAAPTAAVASPQSAAVPPAAVNEGAAASEVVGPIPTADEHPAASDHDAVVGHVGIQARRLDPGPLPLALRPGLGCAADMSTPCTVTLGALGARYWMTRNFAWNAYLAFGAGGGSVGSSGAQGLDTYLGVGPIVGLTLLLANWRHLAIGASPELGVVWFRPGGTGSGSTKIVEVRAALEAELHFGFVGVPALSIGLEAGAQLQYEGNSSAHLWSVGMTGAGSVWDSLTDLFVRYYL